MANNIALNEALYRIGGQYGYVITDDGHVRAEITEIQGTVEINRIEVPIVGSTRQGFKPGREMREGTFQVQKIDSFWEMQVYRYLSQNLQQRRDRRGTAEGAMRPFKMVIHLDDPDALGEEVWQLDGCLLWRLPLGFSIGDDLVGREFPFTWEQETPLSAFQAISNQTNPANGFPAVSYTFDGVVRKPNPATP